LDPRTKLLLLLMVNILMYSFGASLYIYLSVALAAVLMLLAGNYRYLLYIGGFYAILFTIDYAMGFAPENLLLLWNTLSIPFFIFLPFIMYAMLFFTTTTINDAAAAFQKMRMPSFVLIPLLVMFRFIPTIYQEFRAITNAMKLRGVAGGGNPVRAVEYVYVPLLFSLVKIGEELTLASLTRGLGLHKDRTYVNEPVMRWYDYAALVVMLLLVLGSRWGPTL
ncbi:MAG: energy-coupling factor transporter transmembrane component T, partial [Chloroflexota bacterium]